MRTERVRVVSALLVLIAWGTSAEGTAPASADGVSGIVQSGVGATAEPLSKVKVTLYQSTTNRPRKLGSARTNRAGRFELPVRETGSSGIYYVAAEIGLGVRFLTVLGARLPENLVTVNELTTVAAAYSTAQFSRSGDISGDAFALRIAAGMNDNLVSIASGEPSPVLLASPNADETNSLRSTRALANLLRACERHPVVRAAFLGLTRPPRGPFPRNTADAMANLARNPGQNVALIYVLTKLAAAYEPPLFRMPDAWTITVKVNDSGDDRFLFGGPSNVAFDSRGYAWVGNNVVQGKTTSARHIMVLKPNGKPSDGANGTPRSPIHGGGILGVGFGVTVDPFGSAWVGNFGWGGDNPTPMGNGSVSQFTLSGAPVSGPLGYQGGPVRAQATVSDSKGNIWIASFGNDSVYVFPSGDHNQSVGFPLYEGSQPFDIRIDRDGEAWVTNGGGFDGSHPSSVAKFRLNDSGALELLFLRHVGKALKVVGVDSRGNGWVASQGDNTVYAFKGDGTPIGGFTGGGIDGPWGIAVDGEDNVWVSNFGPLQRGNDFTTGGISKLCGSNPATRPPGLKLGDPITPPTGYTLHSAGSQVLLHDGTPLYGSNGPPSFAPLMRQTSVIIDRAGNLWSINNWKPSFDIDITSNPGGDGIVIFVGLAPPPRGVGVQH